MRRSRHLRFRLAAVVAAAASAVTGLSFAAPTTASASGCLISLGPSVNVYSRAGYQGTFYLGYNTCTHNVYAELDNPYGYGTDVITGYVDIVHVSGEVLTTDFLGGYRHSFVSPMDYIYKGGTRQYYGYMKLNMDDAETCYASTDTWNFSNGSYSYSPSSLAAYCD